MITVDDILREKRHTRVVTLRMQETVADAVRVMKRENISSVIVTDICGTEGSTVMGVFSERDVTRALLEHGSNTPRMLLASLLKREVISCRLDDGIATVLRLMDEHQVRHLPVMEEYTLIGVISATDLMRHYLREAEMKTLLDPALGGMDAHLTPLR
ncbi:CBS domain-containing protein [Xanthobacter dioxanivorans]|uniref:CBS domain-containing protein n=1 Tax=Xanthobacter dioxanivorans TaxID=2528964 RepID=A0A974PJP5_9HYPH|nr:CBS domain-containing protein [Xanthobacter dioxanivorans]QRG04754.1 CBS domain-containing protein [Xanthobacter dioxanivorans]